VTAAGEWLRNRSIPCRPGTCLRLDSTCGNGCRAVDDGAGAPPPAPAPLVSGAIGRGLADAREAYRQQLVDVWHAVGSGADPGPWDD
jgi:hypothetical protein